MSALTAMLLLAVLSGPALVRPADAGTDPRPGPHPPALRVAQAESAEIAFWRSVRDSDDPAELEAYLEAYPEGQFAPLARIRLEKLRAPAGGEAGPEAPAAPVEGEAERAGAPPRAEAEAIEPPQAEALAALRTGERGWIGVQTSALTAQRARQAGLDGATGALAVGVMSYGTAAAAGVAEGDVIVDFDGRPVSGIRHFARIVAGTWPGRTVPMTVLRDGTPQRLMVPVGDWLTENRKAAEAGHASAMYQLGRGLESGRGLRKDPARAARWYRAAAEAGHAEAQYRLATLYARGLGVGKDELRAIAWLQEAAGQGHAPAQVALARRYQSGEGVARDEDASVHWYRAAAEQGNADAQLGLGDMYAHGLGVEQDHGQAAELYRRAASTGNLRALNNLAGLIWDGLGTEQDRDEAIRLWRQAALKGHAGAIENLIRLGIPLYDMADIQRRLAELGHDPGPVDGKLGPNTRRAIESFQEGAGLAVDGEPSLALLDALITAGRRQAEPPPAAAPAGEQPPPEAAGEAEPDDGGLADLD